jgi:hypothetical protein
MSAAPSIAAQWHRTQTEQSACFSIRTQLLREAYHQLHAACTDGGISFLKLRSVDERGPSCNLPMMSTHHAGALLCVPPLVISGGSCQQANTVPHLIVQLQTVHDLQH